MSENEYLHTIPKGHVIDQYRIIDVLGVGGFGITYLAEHEVLGSKVAVKEYLPNDFAVRQGLTVAPKSKEDEESFQWGLSRFIDEARTVVKFNHPNIVRVHSFFEANSTAYMVMDYEEGESLNDILARKSKLSEAELQSILLPIIDGLRSVHSAGVLHRDIKPSNIFIRTSDGSPVLLDFGSARHAISKKSMSMTAITSPGYSPPEQYETEGESQGSWSDIYSLAALSFRAITGIKPDDALARERKILRDGVDPLPVLSERKEAKNFSPEFLGALMHGLKANERERPQSLDEWLSEMSLQVVDATPTTTPSQSLARPRTQSDAKFLGLSSIVEFFNSSIQSISSLAEQHRRYVLPGASIIGIVIVLILLSSLLIYWVNSSHDLEETEQVVLQEPDVQVPVVEPEIVDEDTVQEEGEIDFGESIVDLTSIESVDSEEIEEIGDAEQMAEVEGQLILNLEPEDARVTIFDIPDKYEAGGITLPVGTYRIRVMSSDYVTRFMNVEVTEASEPIDIQLQLDPNPPLPMSVSVRPSHATIRITDANGDPVEYEDGSRVRAGEYRIEASAEGFRTGIVQVNLDESNLEHTLALTVKWRIGGEFKDCENCPVMTIVDGNTYSMGSAWRDRNRNESVNVHETPAHEVDISSLAVAKHEITFDQWQACVDEGGCNGYSPEAKWGRENIPIVEVSWDDAQAYVSWLSSKSSTAYRLPSESEWEFLARAGTETDYSFGDSVNTTQANYNGHEGGPVDVNRYAPNGFQLYNMHGNVMEWVADCWNRTYAGDIEPSRERNPFRPKIAAPVNGEPWDNPSCTRRVVRGGSWKSEPLAIDSRFRDSRLAQDREDDLGFRIVTSQSAQAAVVQ